MSWIMTIYDWIRKHDPISDTEYYTTKMRRNVKKNAGWWIIGFGLAGGLLALIGAWILLHLGGLA